MSSDKDNTSTLQSYMDSASSTVQSAIGSLTGNPADKVRYKSSNLQRNIRLCLTLRSNKPIRRKRLPKLRMTSPTLPPELAPLLFPQLVPLPKTPRTALKGHGIRLLALPKNPLVTLLVPRD